MPEGYSRCSEPLFFAVRGACDLEALLAVPRHLVPPPDLHLCGGIRIRPSIRGSSVAQNTADPDGKRRNRRCPLVDFQGSKREASSFFLGMGDQKLAVARSKNPCGPKWVVWGSGNMGTKTCGLPLLFNFEPHPTGTRKNTPPAPRGLDDAPIFWVGWLKEERAPPGDWVEGDHLVGCHDYTCWCDR